MLTLQIQFRRLDLGERGMLPTFNMEKKYTITIEIEYDDETGFTFDVTLEGEEHEVMAELSMITRGTLRASSAYKATAYKQDGFPICSYVNR